MKKLGITLSVFFALAMILAAPAWAAKHPQAQSRESEGEGSFNQGMVVVGGDSDLAATGGDRYTSAGKNSLDDPWTNVDFDAFAGYFVIKGVEVGGFVNADYAKNDTKETFKQGDVSVSTTSLNTTTEWDVGPQAGYFYQIIHQIGVFGRLDIGYGGVTDLGGTKDKKTTTTDSGFIVRPVGGAVFLVTRNVGISISLYFKYYAGTGKITAPGLSDQTSTVSEPSGGMKIGILGFL